MKFNHLKRSIAEVLSRTTEFVEAFEALPWRHRNHDRSVVIATEFEERDLPDTALESAPLGCFVAAVSAPDTASLEALGNSLDRAGAPAAAVARVVTEIAAIREFQTLYVAGRYAALTLGKFRDVVMAYTQNAREALDDADSAAKAWLAAAPAEVNQVGTLIGDKWYLTTAHVAELCDSTRDAARKLIREKAIQVFRIGRNNYVSRDDFLEATRTRPGDRAA